MYYVMTERERLVESLPTRATAAEIGVAQGDFAAALLAKAAPSKLHLIDPWGPLERKDERGDFLATVVAARDGADAGPSAPQAASPGGDARFRAVQDRFTGDARVVFHRKFSYRAAREFPDRSLDFVYVDGNHTYEYVLRDLLDFAPKIKEDGLILGHDFFQDAFAAEHNYGIVGAVNTFLARSGFIFVALTFEPFPTFVLAKSFDGFAAAFVRNLLDSEIFMVEVPTALAFAYHELSHKRRDGSMRRIPSFARM